MDLQLGGESVLSRSECLLTFIAGYTASGNRDGLRAAWQALDSADSPGAIEVILQTHLFAGYPRTINALNVVRGLGEPSASEHRESHEAAAIAIDWETPGEALCSLIYGDNYSKLRVKMAGLHPDLDTWILQVGYGRVLSRPGLSTRLRELCVIAVLAGQDVTPQLISHLRGAVHAGATVAECQSVLEQTRFVWGEVAHNQALRVFEKIKSKLRAS